MTLVEQLQERGYRRIGTMRNGFRFVDPAGRQLKNGELPRIRALKLPPAWSDVFVSPEPGTKLQAIGKDRAGRWQYRYHPTYRQRRESAKYRRLVRFAEALPDLRAAVDRDLRRKGLPREKVLACAVHLVASCFMRAGSREYAEKHQSYGVATLKAQHVQVIGDRVRFDYTGKAGKRQTRVLEDPRIARIVRALLRLPGADLLKFVGEDGSVVDVRRRHVNEYIKQHMGSPFTAKDFRTWAGTLLCACELARHSTRMIPGRTDRKRVVAAAVKATAARLGNTPAVCKSSYIFPAVLEGFSKGKVIRDHLHDVADLARQKGLHGSEQALIELLVASS